MKRIPILAVSAGTCLFWAFLAAFAPASGYGLNISQQAYIKASNTGAGDNFGSTTRISGDTIVVGAIGESSDATGVNGDQGDNSVPYAGAAYVFVNNGTNWMQQAYLKPSNTKINPYGIGNWFGSVAIDGDTIVVGALGESSDATGVNGDQSDNSAPYAGAAYVFVRNGTNWTQQAYLKASNTDALDEFGISVAISGDTIIVGANAEACNATGVNGIQTDNSAMGAGAAYVFVRNGTNWTQQAYLKASNTDAGDYFGTQVAISSNTIVVGALYESSNATGVNGNQSDNSATNSGAAYVFVRNGTNWTQQAYLKASNTDAGDYFGAAQISDDTIVVVAPGESSSATGVNGDQSDNSAPFAGAAYVFVRNGTNWSQQAYLKASNTDAGDTFGGAGISGDTIVAGAIFESSKATGVNGDQSDNSAPKAGAAYVFVRNGTNWSQQAYLKASNTDADDHFSGGVISGNTIVCGALNESSSATGINGNQFNNSAPTSGAVYVFILTGTGQSNGTSQISCALTPAFAINTTGTAHTVTATVASNGVAQSGALVNFSVTAGPNLGNGGTATTSASGQGSFTYTGSSIAGTDTIQAISLGATGTATKVWIAVGSSGCTNTTFATPTGSPIGVGSSPYFVSLGDFNGDGKPDLAVANTGSNNVTILLGDGSGGFTEAAGSPVGTGSMPRSVAVDDFDGDGTLDLAVANFNSGNVTILLGNGSGGFTEAVGSPVSVGFGPLFVSLGDFNGDGKPDLAVANYGSDNVTILLGDGHGGFSQPTGSPIGAGDGPESVAAGDFNHDGKLDLAVANFNSDDVTILLGDGHGGFSQPTGSPIGAGSLVRSVAVDDFNGDGKPDLAVANGTSPSGTVTILLGDGSGGFSQPAGSPVGAGSLPFTVAVGDINDDGKGDLVVANFNSQNVTVLLGDGIGGFSQPAGSPVGVVSSPYFVVVGDFNGDGKPDLAVSSGTNPGTVTILLNTCTAGFSPQVVACTLSPALGTNTVGAAHTVTAMVTSNSNPVAGASVNFSVAGPNASAHATKSTSVSGTASFTYTGTGGAGIDTIRAVSLGATGTATKVWVSAACTYTLSATSVTLTVKGGTKSVRVKASNSDCSWIAASNDPFITITRSTATMVKFSVPGNTNTTTLSGTMTIAGQTFTVNQAAGGCTYRLSPRTAKFKATGGSKTVRVNPNLSDCDWTAVSNDSFITITGGMNGVGRGAVSYNVAPNVTTNVLIGTMTIAGQTYSVTQSGSK